MDEKLQGCVYLAMVLCDCCYLSTDGQYKKNLNGAPAKLSGRRKHKKDRSIPPPPTLVLVVRFCRRLLI